jgi:hypothetical protein
VVKNQNNKSVSEPPSLHGALKARSRQRRGELAALVTSSPALSPTRNDPVPKLTLIECALVDLGASARNVRKIKATHLSEVASAISRLGFCDPVLIDERNSVLDGLVRVEPPSF